MRTSFDDFVDVFGAALESANEEKLAKLSAAMELYEAKYASSFRNLLRIPAFRKLWDEMGFVAERSKHLSYWDEKRKDRREEFLEEDAVNAERAFPTRRPS